MHILSASQFKPEDLTKLFEKADAFRTMMSSKSGRATLADKHKGYQFCSLFFEPSTRTRTSFEAAALKIGMGVVSTENASEFSSATKGETIEDTIKVLNEYDFAAIVIRHPETGAIGRAAAVSKVPIINGGDGKAEHPTQSLLDMYTIHRKFKHLDNLHVVIGGDLRYNRTARSLAKMLSIYPNNKITFVSLKSLQMGDDVKEILRNSNTEYSEEDNMSALKTADVVYWNRLQRERIDDGDKDQAIGLIIDSDAVQTMPENSILMHALPRIDEISVEVDSDPRAYYFEQAGNGLYLRMALLDEVISAK
ncbi:MAG: aspartate carbamoyltransferase [Candidatus Saccharimonadales bacterium]